MATAPSYPTLTQAIATLRQLIHFKDHLKAQVGVKSYYFASEPTELLQDLTHFLGIITLHQRAFPLEKVPIPDWVDVKHLPPEVFTQINRLVQGWFPLGDEWEDGDTHDIRFMPFYQDWWEEDWYRLDPVIHVVMGLLHHAEWHEVLTTHNIDPRSCREDEVPLTPDRINLDALKALCEQQGDNRRYLWHAVATIDNFHDNPFLAHYDMVDSIRLDNLDALVWLKQEFQEAQMLVNGRYQLNQWLEDASPQERGERIKALATLWNQAADWQQLSLLDH